MEFSASASSKRARTPGNGTQVPSCLVDGCTADLSKCRDYHRRHKVCELHSKTPRVTIQGQEQRFCQQCSRFHSLVEFDEGKRSCRKRLDGHNRRRRKSQPDTPSINSGRFLPNHQGARFVPFGSPQVFSASAITPAWAGVVKARTELMLHNHHTDQLDFSNRNFFQDSSSQDYKGGKQLPFLEGTNCTEPGASICQPLLTANSSSGNGVSSQKMLANDLHRVIDSGCALSLLSSPPAETREIGLRHMMQTDSIPPARSPIPSFNYNGQGINSEPIRSAFFSESSSSANHSGQDIFQIGTVDSSPSRTHQTISFSWE